MELFSALIGVAGIGIGYLWGRSAEKKAKARHLLLARKMENPTAAGFTYENGEPVGLRFEMEAESGGYSATGADADLKKANGPKDDEEG